MRKVLFGMAGSLTLLALVSGFILSSITTSAEEIAISNVSVSVPASCSLSTDTTNDTAHTANINNGTYQDNIGTTTFKVFCNDSGGFSVYAVGYSNQEFGNTKLLATVNGTLSPTNDIITGIGTNETTTGGVSNWAMKLTPVTGTYAPTIESDTNGSYASYHVVPNQYTKVATFNSTTDTTSGSAFQSTYAAYIANTQPAGTYQGKVRYAMVHPASEVPNQPHDATVGCISYWPNASGVVDSMGDQCSYGNNQTDVTLWASNFKRQGYGFVGWSDKFDWVLNANDANGNGTGENEGYHIYGPNQNITTPSNMTTKGLSLYAVWAKSTGNIQSWTGCGAMNVGQVTALTDQRDNDTYAVAKLADNKCWMIENLRLDNTGLDNENGSLAQGYNTSTFKGLANPEAPWADGSTAANSLYSTDGANNTFAITGYDQDYRFPRYNNVNASNTVTNMTTTDANIYSYGNYYTWPAAIADTTNYTTNGQTISNTSICPKGWHLPYGYNATTEYGGNTAGGFYYLGDKLGATSNNSTSSNIWRSYPNNFIYSGYVFGSSVGERGSYGVYWSSTVGDNVLAYILDFSSSGVYPGTNDSGKYNGFMARCIAGS